MSPNAGLVRSFPQTSIKAPRKAGLSAGAHVAWGLSPHATDFLWRDGARGILVNRGACELGA